MNDASSLARKATAAAQQVGPDQLRALFQLGQAQLARPGDRLVGALLGAAGVEAGQQLQLAHERRQVAGAGVEGGHERRAALVGRRRRTGHARSIGILGAFLECLACGDPSGRGWVRLRAG